MDTLAEKIVVSIVIPVFNVENFIKTGLDNILSQSLEKWELIAVDDGSTDKTFEILCDYARHDSRIKALKRNTNEKGSLVCRNIGQKLVKGKYFVHFDSDDIIEPFCLLQRVEFMERHPELDYATFRGQSVIQQKDGSVKREGRSWGENPDKDILSCFLSANYPFSVWNNIYRTESFKDYFWDENVKIYTDFSYIVPAILDGKKHAFDIDSKPDYLYRMGQGNAMTSSFISPEKYESTKYLFEKTMNMIPRSYRRDFKSFFLLQFQRVLQNGRPEQVEDFRNFFKKYYPHLGIRLSLLILYWSANKGMPPKYREKIKYFTYVLFEPNTVIIWIKHRLKRK